jgi:hypothetical protein
LHGDEREAFDAEARAERESGGRARAVEEPAEAIGADDAVVARAEQ